MSDDVLIRVEGVSKRYCRDLKRSLWYGLKDTGADLTGRSRDADALRRDEFWAVDDVSFEVKRGECLGLIGRNGAGKTTLLKMLNGLVKPDKGRIEMRGRVGALIALGAGFNPILTGRENVYVNGAVLGLSKREIDAKFDEIVDFAEIEDFIDAPVQSYSSGMQVRLGFAIATAVEPDVLLLDEVLAVGDANFQARCYDRIGTILPNAAVILVSHQIYNIRRMCNIAIFLSRGSAIRIGSPSTVITSYDNARPKHSSSSFTVLGREISGAQVNAYNDKVHSGETLEVELQLELRSDTICDQAYMNIVDGHNYVHAQMILSDLIGATFARGIKTVLISIGPLYLSRGNFSGHILLWTGGGRRTLVQMRHAFSFFFEGPVSMGPLYYPRASVTVKPGPST